MLVLTTMTPIINSSGCQSKNRFLVERSCNSGMISLVAIYSKKPALNPNRILFGNFSALPSANVTTAMPVVASALITLTVSTLALE